MLLGLGGLIALRHASYAGTDRSWLLVIWAAGTMLTLVLVDRADAEIAPALEGGSPLPNRLTETARFGAVIALVVSRRGRRARADRDEPPRAARVARSATDDR